MSATTETPNQRPETAASGPSPDQPLVFTEAAVRKVVEFSEKFEDAKGKHLRLSVNGGGCSGFEYGFSFDEIREEDEVISQGDGRIKVLVDPFSMPYLEGCVVDYVESFAGSGFKVSNPNASGVCGCGHSFTA